MYQDFSAVSALYSQLAGVLAGFAFASLIAVLVAPLSNGSLVNRSWEAVSPLAATFVGLVATSLNYAIATGEKSRSARAALLETTAGFGFCVAGLMLFFSLLILIVGTSRDTVKRPVGTDQLLLVLRITIVFVVAPLLPFLMMGGTTDYLIVQYGVEHWRESALFRFSISLVVLTQISCIFMWIRYRKTKVAHPRLTMQAALASVILSATSLAGVTALLIFFTDTDVFADYVLTAEITVVVFFVNAIAYVATRIDR